VQVLHWIIVSLPSVEILQAQETPHGIWAVLCAGVVESGFGKLQNEGLLFEAIPQPLSSQLRPTFLGMHLALPLMGQCAPNDARRASSLYMAGGTAVMFACDVTVTPFRQRGL
jgi:hypothetical protein